MNFSSSCGYTDCNVTNTDSENCSISLLYSLIIIIFIIIIISLFWNKGLRKPPPRVPGYENYLLAQLKNLEQARRRFQQERQQQQQYSFPNNEIMTQEMSGPGFTYKLPIQYPLYANDDEEIPFAVAPGHPKYYEKIDSNTKSEPIITYQNVLGAESDPVHLTSDGIPSYKVKAPMNVNPKIIPNDDYTDDIEIDNTYDISKSKDVLTRDDLKVLFENLQQKGQAKAIVNEAQPLNEVAKKPVDLNSAWVIAIIAGVSAAFTVGLLAIGIGWYT